MKKTMTAISLHLPTPLVRDSKKIAVRLGVSRAQFIRMAIEQAILDWRRKQETEAVLKAFVAMKTDQSYSKEAHNIMDSLNTDLPDEEEKWWKE